MPQGWPSIFYSFLFFFSFFVLSIILSFLLPFTEPYRTFQWALTVWYHFCQTMCAVLSWQRECVLVEYVYWKSMCTGRVCVHVYICTVLPSSTLAWQLHPPPATEHLHQNVFFTTYYCINRTYTIQYLLNIILLIPLSLHLTYYHH